MKTMILTIALVLGGGAALAQTNESMPSQPLPAENTTPTYGGSGGGAMQACRADIQSLCSGMKPGDGKLGQCVRSNMSKLSSGCQDALKSMRGQRGGQRRQR